MAATSSNQTSTSCDAVTLTVTPSSLTVTGITASNKTYDTTTAATLSTGSAALSGVVGDDTVVLHTGGATGVFANANAGTAKGITISGLTITGSSASNYTLTQPTTVTATIAPKPSPSPASPSRTKSTMAPLPPRSIFLSALISGLFLSELTPATSPFPPPTLHATFANAANVGTAKAITITGITLTGSAATNYTVTQPTGLTANITAKALTITGLTANNKTYDGTATASLNSNHLSLTGVVSTDSRNISLTRTNVHGTFADANAGAGKSITVSGLSLSGTAAANYTLTTPTPTATITPKSSRSAASPPSSKTYDGTTAATLGGTGVLSGDMLTADALNVGVGSVTGVFNSANVGTNKITLTVALSGTAAGNYSVSDPGLSAGRSPPRH